ncbi:MAG: hypothetical protein J7518_20455 [Nocardioidaceae bacterium]|nr:hypothetical protein [Nocardioidaceae bacterium]
MVADLSASAYLVDGVDLASASVKLTHDGSGLWTGSAENIGVTTFPGLSGGGIEGGVFPPYLRSTMYLIRGTNYDDVLASIRALRRRCKPGLTVILSRTMPDPEGGASNTTQTVTARRQDDRIDWPSETVATLDIDWLITGGPWLGTSINIASAAGAHAILGDLPTRAMTITLAAGAARTVTNTVGGVVVAEFTFNATVPTGGVVVDVVAKTAKAITGGTDLSSSLSWTKLHPMLLHPGSNTLTVSAGTASIDYQPAYQ